MQAMPEATSSKVSVKALLRSKCGNSGWNCGKVEVGHFGSILCGKVLRSTAV